MEEEKEAVFPGHYQAPRRHAARKQMTVAAPYLELQAIHLAPAAELVDQFVALFLGFPNPQIARSLADDFLACVAQHAAKGRVDFQIAAIGDARHAGGVWHGVVHSRELGLRGVQGFLDLAVRRDVVVHADHARGASVGAAFDDAPAR